MPKTTAELTALTQLLQEQLGATKGEVADLWVAHRRLEDQFQKAREEQVRGQQELSDTRRLLDEERASGSLKDEKITELQTKYAAEKSRTDEVGRQLDSLNTRVWGLIVVLLVAALGFIGYSLRK